MIINTFKVICGEPVVGPDGGSLAVCFRLLNSLFSHLCLGESSTEVEDSTRRL